MLCYRDMSFCTATDRCGDERERRLISFSTASRTKSVRASFGSSTASMRTFVPTGKRSSCVSKSFFGLATQVSEISRIDSQCDLRDISYHETRSKQMNAQKIAHTFPLASQAAAAVAAFDEAAAQMFQYEIILVRAADFTIQGFQARVKDLDGFGVGYVAPVQAVA